MHMYVRGSLWSVLLGPHNHSLSCNTVISPLSEGEIFKEPAQGYIASEKLCQSANSRNYMAGHDLLCLPAHFLLPASIWYSSLAPQSVVCRPVALMSPWGLLERILSSAPAPGNQNLFCNRPGPGLNQWLSTLSACWTSLGSFKDSTCLGSADSILLYLSVVWVLGF